ncbi:DUF805 domain-containing protein [Stenotrophomonas sp.]|uniref:DUF805 domain-containing protein n=1 Tax=Stenotrophomonas sp. TaxID=69392 RepID=UPI0025E280E9|nr:DUF805 domain-containing protein [Stenotrophomonas sp.]MBW8375259.1 DUF805 domain-containing protein [Stenotrophomonas sp.]
MSSIFPTDSPRLPSLIDCLGFGLLPLKRYRTFSGRASRREFWAFSLLASAALGSCYALMMWSHSAIWIQVGMSVGAVLVPLLLLPMIAVTIRRLHDIDESGWLAVIVLVPLGVFVFFPLMLLPPTPGTNRFGSRAPEDPQSGA